MPNLQQQDGNGMTTTVATTTGINVDGNFYYSKFGGIPATITSTIATTTPLPLQQLQHTATTTTATTTPLADQMLYENYNVKWDEATLEQKIAALKLETQKQLLNEFMLQKAQMQNAQLAAAAVAAYPTEFHLRTPKVPSQRNRELYKTALCDFWSAGIPCRFGERCWFAHGPHELRIARFVYPGLHPYDYEIRMNPSTTTLSYGRQRFWNSEQQSFPIGATLTQQPSLPMTITPMGQNVPIGYERNLRRISPVHENTNSKSWRTTQQRTSDGDSGIGSAGTNNSPEVNVKHRENLDITNYQYSPFYETPLTNDHRVMPTSLHRPLDTLTNREQRDFSRNEAYNRWLSTETLQSNNVRIGGGSLEQVNWWPDTINHSYPYINRPNQYFRNTTTTTTTTTAAVATITATTTITTTTAATITATGTPSFGLSTNEQYC